MAAEATVIDDRTGTTVLFSFNMSTSFPGSTTIDQLLAMSWNTFGITALSTEIGGAVIPGTDTIANYSGLVLYDVTPQVETITGFYLDGTEYKFEGGGTAYNAGPGIAIGSEHPDTQGPAPEGFHVPLITEWKGLKTIMDGLSLTTGNNWKTNLHMPFSGFRSQSSSNPVLRGEGDYWSSSPYESNYTFYASALSLMSSSVNTDDYFRRASALSVRCFKDSYEAPDSTWTVVQGTLGSAGIFWDQSQGLISITDGTTGYTIMDKNLGATTVYNDGDTLSEANCGKYYQWGNNYGFPRTGSVTTSSTQVDASGYGPGNYYESDTFIAGPSDWSSIYNDNLWGGVTQGIWVSGDGNTIVNTGVLSVNGQTGNITVQTYTAGNGINITNGEIGLDGTYEGKWGKDYSAMQGPAPSGFHVPLITEWQGLKTIMDGLGLTTGDNWRINLHMPFAGQRSYFSASLEHQDSLGYYWSSSPYGSGFPDNARNLRLLSSHVYVDNFSRRAYGFSVRCFKDSFEAPTSSWTVVQGTLGSAGIFWNQTDGLISITDGTTGYTIMDKNLGATTVYNDGDTLSEANCGKFYQWGNNYGFSRTGSITTSSTQVDASAYGPGNYYSSSTFIKGSNDWSSVYNDNLWGGVTGLQPIIVSGNLALGDKLYKIVTSTSAPASGTASNVITIVTD